MTDPHLNLFWNYEGKPSLENNVTRALIVLLKRLPPRATRGLVRDTVSVRVQLRGRPTYSLQRTPPLSNGARAHVLAVSRTKDTVDVHKHIQSLSVEARSEARPSLQEAIDSGATEFRLQNAVVLQEPGELAAAMAAIDDLDRGSRPDGWIVARDHSAVVAIESKLDAPVDRGQIKRHCEGLGLDGSDDDWSHVTWQDVLGSLTRRAPLCHRHLVWEFGEYLRMCGLIPAEFDRVSQDLRVMVERIVRESLSDWKLQAEKDPDDFDLFAPDGGVANTGAAFWDGNRIAVKLVVGVKTWHEIREFRERSTDEAWIRRVMAETTFSSPPTWRVRMRAQAFRQGYVDDEPPERRGSLTPEAWHDVFAAIKNNFVMTTMSRDDVTRRYRFKSISEHEEFKVSPTLQVESTIPVGEFARWNEQRQLRWLRTQLVAYAALVRAIG